MSSLITNEMVDAIHEVLLDIWSEDRPPYMADSRRALEAVEPMLEQLISDTQATEFEQGHKAGAAWARREAR